jgi:hypothetical protein
VPLHSALNYDGQLTGQRGVHSRFESELFDRYRNSLALRPPPPGTVGSARDFVFDTLLASFPLVQPILNADRAAASGREFYDDQYFAMFFGKVRPILERRLSEAIGGVATVITAAWVEAGRPAVPVQAARTPRPIRR